MKNVFIILVTVIGMLFLSACGNFGSEAETFNISVNVNPPNAGSVLTSGGDEAGNTVQFFAVPNTGWVFAGWTGSVESFDNPLTFVLENDINLTANFSIFSNNYEYLLLLSDQNSEVELRLGQQPGATDFFDSGVDLESPPPPPGNTLHAWFGGGDRDLLWDYRNAFSPEVIWDLQISGGQQDNLTLTWSRQVEEFNGSLILTDQNGTFETDMTSQNSQSVNAAQAESLQIIYRFEE
ncbi:InlB B-repeat-containing protein [Rhodohalobacter mucosus]|uniref:Bacterial repeat domain-containing protein n=1 Tax=Rhodohalobacter mucosus TaxID=2079485 RepID=A0A316TSM5_9BACT|nr:hypothetical protein [Rhodohalobacter mucosus]PWN07623.1 hypothetical protein DDZ15_05040 [Rhodohalobacter mucosus]